MVGGLDQDDKQEKNGMKEVIAMSYIGVRENVMEILRTETTASMFITPMNGNILNFLDSRESGDCGCNKRVKTSCQVLEKLSDCARQKCLASDLRKGLQMSTT